MDNQYKPQSVSPPGDTLGDVIAARGMTIESLAKLIPCSPEIIAAIVFDQHEITPEMAYRLDITLGIPKAFWIAREKQYRDYLAYIDWLDSNGLLLGHRYDELG